MRIHGYSTGSTCSQSLYNCILYSAIMEDIGVARVDEHVHRALYSQTFENDAASQTDAVAELARRQMMDFTNVNIYIFHRIYMYYYLDSYNERCRLECDRFASIIIESSINLYATENCYRR